MYERNSSCIIVLSLVQIHQNSKFQFHEYLTIFKSQILKNVFKNKIQNCLPVCDACHHYLFHLPSFPLVTSTSIFLTTKFKIHKKIKILNKLNAQLKNKIENNKIVISIITSTNEICFQKYQIPITCSLSISCHSSVRKKWYPSDGLNFLCYKFLRLRYREIIASVIVS